MFFRLRKHTSLKQSAPFFLVLFLYWYFPFPVAFLAARLSSLNSQCLSHRIQCRPVHDSLMTISRKTTFCWQNDTITPDAAIASRKGLHETQLNSNLNWDVFSNQPKIFLLQLVWNSPLLTVLESTHFYC